MGKEGKSEKCGWGNGEVAMGFPKPRQRWSSEAGQALLTAVTLRTAARVHETALQNRMCLHSVLDWLVQQNYSLCFWAGNWKSVMQRNSIGSERTLNEISSLASKTCYHICAIVHL